jgi:hypothetical protein
MSRLSRERQLAEQERAAASTRRYRKLAALVIVKYDS